MALNIRSMQMATLHRRLLSHYLSLPKVEEKNFTTLITILASFSLNFHCYLCGNLLEIPSMLKGQVFQKLNITNTKLC